MMMFKEHKHTQKYVTPSPFYVMHLHLIYPEKNDTFIFFRIDTFLYLIAFTLIFPFYS